jgi:hypothetical protein
MENSLVVLLVALWSSLPSAVFHLISDSGAKENRVDGKECLISFRFEANVWNCAKRWVLKHLCMLTLGFMQTCCMELKFHTDVSEVNSSHVFWVSNPLLVDGQWHQLLSITGQLRVNKAVLGNIERFQVINYSFKYLDQRFMRLINQTTYILSYPFCSKMDKYKRKRFTSIEENGMASINIWLCEVGFGLTRDVRLVQLCSAVHNKYRFFPQ